MSHFTGKRIVLTGASSGIGRELVRQLAPGRPRLCLVARGQQKLDETASEARELGGEVITVAADVTDPDACARVVLEAVTAFNGLDILINNVGASMWARFDAVTDLNVFPRMIEINYLSAVYMTHYALPHLSASGGIVVGLSSIAGFAGVPKRTGYSAAKFAVSGFFEALRPEVKPNGVDVTVIYPGFVATGARDKSLGPDGLPVGKSRRDESKGNIPVDHAGRAILKGIRKRKRQVVVPRVARAGLWLKLVAPGLIDRLATRAVREPGDKG